MKNNKGFSLVEIMTVVIILGILASLSIPFVMGYVRDAKNDRAKSVLYIIAQGFKNFKNDFSHFTLNTDAAITQQSLNSNSNTDSCRDALEAINNNQVDYTFLIKCSFIPNLDYSKLPYNFYLGNSSSCDSACGQLPAGNLACMVGTENDGDYCDDYCAYIDRDNNLREVRGCQTTTEEEETTTP